MWGYNGLGFGGLGMGIGMLVFWGLIVFGILALMRAWGGSRNASERGESRRTALDILDERYARGEIDRSEFEQKLGDLRRTV